LKDIPKIKWTKLDNASKIFPSTMTTRDTKVFRFSCYLKEAVDEKALEKAIPPTLESFPIYKSVLRRGVFWYYLEESTLVPSVEVENKTICAPLYLKEERGLLFRVFYFNNRLSVEIFHALSDGAGAIWFFETLLYHYFTIKYHDVLPASLLKLPPKAAISQKMDDSFEKTYFRNKVIKEEKAPKIQGPAYRLKGTKVEEHKTKLLEGTLSTKEVLSLAHTYNTTLTVFLTALYFYAIYKEMPKKMHRYPIILQVPINLRPYFGSSTARNFYATMNITLDPTLKDWSLEEIILHVEAQFKEEMHVDKVKSHLDHLMSLEKNPFTRILPLPLKDITLKIANALKDRHITSSISNVGRIQMTPEFHPFIEKFSVFVSARRPQIVVCSYEDQLVISFISPFHDTELQRVFFQFFTERGLEVSISSNL